MKIIDGEVYVNKVDAMNAMFAEMQEFKEKEANAEILFCIGLTMHSLISKLFETKEGEKDEHQ